MKIIAWLGVISDLFPVIAALFYYRRLDTLLRIIACFFLLSALSDGLQALFIFIGIRNNYPVIHVYLILSLIFFGLIYYKAFFDPLIKKIVVILTSVGLAVMIYNLIFIEKILMFPSITDTVLSVIVIFYSLMFFFQLLNRQEFIHIEKQPLFWINASILFYYSVTIFLFMLYRKLSPEQEIIYFAINGITNVITNILFTIGILCKPQTTT